MTKANFEARLRGLQEIQPSRAFTVVLEDGKRFEVDRPDKVGFREGSAVFLAPGGIPIFFDHEGVVNFVTAPANSSPNGE